MQLKQELIELLLKIGETNLNRSDLFSEEKPSLFLPEGRTIYLEGDHYYIVGVERGKINSEKKFANKEDILYDLLQSYVTRIASKNAWTNANGDFERYNSLLQEEQIRLFSIINPKYGERRRKQPQNSLYLKSHKTNEETTMTKEELLAFLESNRSKLKYYTVYLNQKALEQFAIGYYLDSKSNKFLVYEVTELQSLIEIACFKNEEEAIEDIVKYRCRI